MSPPFLDIATLQSVLDAFNHCKQLGLQVAEINDRQLTIALPYSEQIIGNPDSGIIHGGAITTLLDTTCGMAIPIAMEKRVFSPTLDLRIDYMTAAKPNMTVYARAEAYRITSNVVFTRGIAYQDDDSKPVAHCVGTFMPMDIKVDFTKGTTA